jgi:hypothetical protein
MVCVSEHQRPLHNAQNGIPCCDCKIYETWDRGFSSAPYPDFLSSQAVHVMSKKQSVSSSVVVCDDAVSGSESDKDIADELRVSMEGMNAQILSSSTFSI